MTRKELGQKIKATRKEHGLSQKEVAEELKLSTGKLSRIENGVSMIGMSKLEKFVALCGIDLEEFLEIRGDNNDGA
ncbi:MAG: helix-turn-helix transcriptional regulator [Prevotellaceae bacterium]|nr:helix-turn-helix transcriptional regulator [Prevotellaceae bacterium]